MIQCGDKVILFGLTKAECKPAEHYLEKYDTEHKILMIIDNNPDLVGEFRGIPVCPQSALTDYVNDETVTIIITAVYKSAEIRNILLEMGFSENRVITAMADRDFYLSYGACFYRTIYVSKPLQPVRINLEFSRACNCRCIYCPFHGVDTNADIGSGKRFMSWEVLRAITEQIGKIPSITAADFIGKGEAYLHPEWYEMMDYLLSNSYVKDIVIYSNGMLLNQDTARKLAKLPFRSLVQEVSIDGETPEENNLYRIGSDYETIRKNIYEAADILSNRNVTFSLMNTHPVTRDYLERHNYTLPPQFPVPEFMQRDFPAEMRKGARATNRWGQDSPCEANGVRLSSQRVKNEAIKYPPCENLFAVVAVNFLGDILDCSCDKDYSKSVLGSVLTDNLLNIWQKSTVMEEMRQVFMNGGIPRICGQCWDAPIPNAVIAVKA